MSIILANFGKYAISDCPFIIDVDVIVIIIFIIIIGIIDRNQ